MNQSYNQMFTEQEILDENKYQIVRMGVKNDDPNFRVIIHKFNKDDHLNMQFKDLLDCLQNVLHIEEDDEHIIMVSKFLEGDNISLHLNFSNVSEEERLDYLYEYLHQAVAYIGFDNNMFNILISSNQITFIDQKFYLKEHIILDRRINGEMPFTMIAKNIGQVMQRLLITNYHELRTSKKYDDLHRFTDSLIRREKDYHNFDELFNDFKTIYLTKTFTKKHVLMGESHPNNMYLDQTQDMPFIPTQPEPEEIIPEIVPVVEMTSEVTEEERAILTGPIEESIDLSKLTGSIASLEDLLVKDEVEEEIIIEEDQEEIEAETTIDVEEEDLKVWPIKKDDIDTPTYGVPNHFKEDSKVKETPVKKTKEAFKHWKLVLTVLAALLLALSMFFVGKFVLDKLANPSSSSVVSQVPDALFDVTIEDSTLFCKNMSIAYGDEKITESLWVVAKNGEEIMKQSQDGLADLRANNLTEGVYSIKLTVTDSAHQSSDPFTREKEYSSTESRALENQKLSEARLSNSFKATDTSITSTELLDLYAINTTDNVTSDTSIYNTGTQSFKLDLTERATVSFTDLDIPKASTISFWMMSDKADSIKVHVSGYNNGFINYDKTFETSHTDVLSWTVISVQLNIEEATDNIVLTFPEGSKTIWLDDLSIRTFK